MKNIITGSENKIREIMQKYEFDQIGAYADASLFIVYEDEKTIGLTSNTVEIEVIKEVIKEVEKIIEVDNPKLLDKISSLAQEVKAYKDTSGDMAKEIKTLKSLNTKLKKTVESLTE